jgi:hypothetical protein
MGALDLSEYVRVKNNSGINVKGRFDGKDYLFQAGNVTDIHQDAAKHIFGFGEDDKIRAFHRLGWLSQGETVEMAEERLKDFEFSEVPSPAIDIKAKKSKNQQPTPLADAGAKEGAGLSLPAPSNAPQLDGEVEAI